MLLRLFLLRFPKEYGDSCRSRNFSDLSKSWNTPVFSSPRKVWHNKKSWKLLKKTFWIKRKAHRFPTNLNSKIFSKLFFTIDPNLSLITLVDFDRNRWKIALQHVEIEQGYLCEGPFHNLNNILPKYLFKWTIKISIFYVKMVIYERISQMTERRTMENLLRIH